MAEKLFEECISSYREEKKCLLQGLLNHQFNLLFKGRAMDFEKSLKKNAKKFWEGDQFGYCKERGTRNASRNLKCLAEGNIDFSQDLFLWKKV